MFRPKTLLTLLLLFCWTVAASAQERVWNAALDWYEYVCAKCAEWKDRTDRGEPVPKDSLQIMAKELSAVKQNLQSAWGEMTPGQRLRFEIIRDRFATGRWHPEIPSPLPHLPILCNSVSTPAATGALPGLIRWMNPPAVHKTVRPRVHIGFIAGLTAGVYPDYSAGGMAGITLGNWGLFLKGRSNFATQATDYECLSDGTTEDGYFWSGDEKKVLRHQMALDVSYTLARPVSLYAGAGYGVRTLCWKDSRGLWALVKDRSFSGLSAEGGVLIHPLSRGPAKGLTVLVGFSWIQGGYVDAEAGLCFRF